MDELIDAYLSNNLECSYYWDLWNGIVIMEMDEAYTGEPGIDWDDPLNEDRYISIPQIDTNEAYDVMMKFAKHTDSDPKMQLFNALKGSKSFQSFKDTLSRLDLWEEWGQFERSYAEDEIRSWIEKQEQIGRSVKELFGVGKKGRNELKRKVSPKKTMNISLPDLELHAILRAADDIIAEGGRTQLAKILKGSKEKKLLELGLDRNPSYGFYRDLTLEKIMEKVDHMIRTDFIKTELGGKLPMIEFTARGWAIERERRAEELLREWDHYLDNKITPFSMDYLKERNRGMIFLFLFKILCSGDKKYIPFLQMWEKFDVKKVRAAIEQVIEDLNRRDRLGENGWHQMLEERAKSLIVRSTNPIFLTCQECGNAFVFDEFDLSCYTAEGLRFPEKCPNCGYHEGGKQY